MSYSTNHIPAMSPDVVVMTRAGLEEICTSAFQRGYYRGKFDANNHCSRQEDDFDCVAEVARKAAERAMTPKRRCPECGGDR